MKLSTVLVVAALAFSAANAYNVDNLRATKDEELTADEESHDEDQKGDRTDQLGYALERGQTNEISKVGDSVPGRGGQGDDDSSMDTLNPDIIYYLKPCTGRLPGNEYVEITKDLYGFMLMVAKAHPNYDPSSHKLDWVQEEIDWMEAQIEDSVSGKQGVSVDEHSTDKKIRFYVDIFEGSTSGSNFPVITKRQLDRFNKLFKSTPLHSILPESN